MAGMNHGDAARGLRVGLTLALAGLAALLAVRARVPVPWMIGPLLATAAARMAGWPAASSIALRNAGQWVIGAALGLYFTPQVTALVLGLWWAVALAVLFALGLGALFGGWMQRALGAAGAGLTPAQRRATAWFASSVGGASEMTLLAERAGARADLVAAAHSVRMTVVVLVLPLPCSGRASTGSCRCWTPRRPAAPPPNGRACCGWAWPPAPAPG
jgi:membrane AbrB-like protein